MEPFQHRLIFWTLVSVASLFSSIICSPVVDHHSSELSLPLSSESLRDDDSIPESPLITSMSSPSPLHSSSPFDYSHVVHRDGDQGKSPQCSWETLTSSLSDDQMLKKALDVYASRNGDQRLREVIAQTTGFLFKGRMPSSLNSVLTPADEYARIRAALDKASVHDSSTERIEPEEETVSGESSAGHYKGMMSPTHTRVLHIQVPGNIRSLEDTIVVSPELAMTRRFLDTSTLFLDGS